MKTVGIREIKRDLSKYLRSVKAGNKVIVTDRNREIAVIVPFKKADDQGKIIAVAQILSHSSLSVPRPCSRRGSPT